jgi:hypothetical protein
MIAEEKTLEVLTLGLVYRIFYFPLSVSVVCGGTPVRRRPISVVGGVMCVKEASQAVFHGWSEGLRADEGVHSLMY